MWGTTFNDRQKRPESALFLTAAGGIGLALVAIPFVTSFRLSTREQQFIGFETVTPGTMLADIFEGFVRDLVNFLEYRGSLEQLESRRVEIWVLVFLLLFLIAAYLLKNESWKDVR